MHEHLPNPDGTCPACGLFVGAAGRCPQCGVATPGRLPLKTLRLLAWVLAGVGLLLLHRAARVRELPYVSADRLTPSMNFAPVRATGTMTAPARIHRHDGEVTVVSFGLLDAEGGELQAVAFGATARALTENGCLPQPGEGVEISGTVRFSARYGPQIHIRTVDLVNAGTASGPESLP